MPIQTVKNRTFKYGVVDSIEPQSIPRGAASASLNWLTMGDHIELRRGSDYLGTASRNAGLGKISGLKKVVDALGIEHLFTSYGQKIKYYDRTTLEWIETGLNLLGAAVVDANGIAKEPVAFSEYTSPAGNQLWACSLSAAGLFKILVGVPGTAIDQYSAAKNFKGLMKIDTNRMLLWNRLTDKTGLYGSYIDNQTYTAVSDLFLNQQGDGANKTFTGYLSFKGKAAGTLTWNATNLSDGDTLTLGSVVYTFKNALTTANQVKIGANKTATMTNLCYAVNLAAGGVAGTNYGVGTVKNPDVWIDQSVITSPFNVYARAPGTAGNTVAMASSNVNIVVSGATLAGGAVDFRTCFGLLITTTIAGVQYNLTDDYAGNLKNASGVSEGTINYATGAFSITYLTAPDALASITPSYQWEDSTVHGIADFTKSSPRTAAQGFIFRQDEGGGAIQTVGSYDQIYYVFHIKKTWVLNIGADDTTATNLPYREKVGVPAARGIVETGDGIYYIDEGTSSDKKIRLLTYDVRGSAKVIPVALSNNIDLNDYDFSQVAGIEFGNFVLWACATQDSTTTIDGITVAVNNRTLVYNRIWKSWDILDYACSTFDIYDGALVGGGSTSNNVFELFSGRSDPDDSDIANFWEGRLDDLDIDGIKKAKGLHVQGLIGPDQKIKVSIGQDRGSFTEVGGEDDATGHTYAIQGDGTYVDTTERVNIGPNVLGKHELGGGSDGASAYNYERIIPLRLDKFEYAILRIEAVGIGPATFSQGDWYDVRGKGRKIPRKYRTAK